MSATNIALLLELVVGLLERASEASKLIRQAQAEGRDVTDAEKAAWRAKDDTARAYLDQAIRDAEAEGR